MKNNLVRFALVYNLLNFLFILHKYSLQEAGDFIYGIILPAFWLISFIFYYEICSRNMGWFRKNFAKGLLITCLCVPILPILFLEFF